MSQPTKKRKALTRTVTLPTVSNEVARLRRTVLASKPELRQASYTLTIAAGAIEALPLIDPNLIDRGTEELRLHRITVNHLHTTGDIPWAIIYSPRQGYEINQIPFPSNPYDVTNYLRHMDNTKQRIFFRKQFGREIVTQADTDSILECDRKFPIPMTVGMRNPGNAVVNHNQLYYIGGTRNASDPKTVEVTVWYTC